MRLKAEYLYQPGQHNKIKFQYVNGQSTLQRWGIRRSLLSLSPPTLGVAGTFSHCREMQPPLLADIHPVTSLSTLKMVDFLVMRSSLSTSIRMGKSLSPHRRQYTGSWHSPHPQHRKPISLPLVHIRRQREEIPLVHYSLQSYWLETLLGAKAKSLCFDDRITLQTAIARSLYWRLYSLISVCHFRYEKVAHACFYLYRPCISSIGTSFFLNYYQVSQSARLHLQRPISNRKI